MKSICFVGMQNYVLNAATSTGQAGGETVQKSLLARQFVAQGFEVSMIVPDVGQADGQEVDGIRLWKTCPDDAGIPIVRFFHPRMTSALRALARADADVYYESPAGVDTGITAAFCRTRGKILIHRIASDVNCIPGQQLIQYWRDRKIYEYGLRHAHLVAAQTQKQVDLLRTNYGVRSSIVNMAVEMPAEESGLPRDIDVLWVNHIRKVKRPELLLELAKRLPRFRFAIVGGAMEGEETLYARMEHEAQAIDNLDFVGEVPYSDVNGYFARARLFVNTSDIEGFPNTFLQAWVRRVPVISFFDPDRLIEKNELGITPHDLDAMTHAVETLLQDGDRRNTLGEKAHAYAVNGCSLPNVVDRYVELIDALDQAS